jgi:hypothetical protein
MLANLNVIVVEDRLWLERARIIISRSEKLPKATPDLTLSLDVERNTLFRMKMRVAGHVRKGPTKRSPAGSL